jgi:hypothetical protein
MKHLLFCVLTACALAGCGGIPLRSIPQLVSLQGKLLDANPGEFMLAIQADARMTPRPGAVPVMHLAIRPRDANAFEAVEKSLPMRLSVSPANARGLTPAPAHRRWFIYSFTPESQAALLRIQDQFKLIQAQQKGKGGGSVSIGIAQEGVAASDPALADTRWESWLQTSKEDGFFELWSGTIGDLLKQSKAPGKQ